ncbi:hypothetical protein SNK04_014307 [Fusarium graminearum]
MGSRARHPHGHYRVRDVRSSFIAPEPFLRLGQSRFTGFGSRQGSLSVKRLGAQPVSDFEFVDARDAPIRWPHGDGRVALEAQGFLGPSLSRKGRWRRFWPPVPAPASPFKLRPMKSAAPGHSFSLGRAVQQVYWRAVPAGRRRGVSGGSALALGQTDADGHPWSADRPSGTVSAVAAIETKAGQYRVEQIDGRADMGEGSENEDYPEVVRQWISVIPTSGI